MTAEIIQHEPAAEMAIAPASIYRPPPEPLPTMEMAETMLRSGLLPQSIKSAGQVIIIAMAGRDFGLTATQSLRCIHVIQGRPTMSAELLAGLVMKHPACDYFQMVESTPESATYETHRKGHPRPSTIRYTLDDAKRAGLTGKDVWKSHPAAMLRARASAALARAVYPDATLGMYATEEMDYSAEYKPNATAEDLDADEIIDATKLEHVKELYIKAGVQSDNDPQFYSYVAGGVNPPTSLDKLTNRQYAKAVEVLNRKITKGSK
jgi:hypothetical protein